MFQWKKIHCHCHCQKHSYENTNIHIDASFPDKCVEIQFDGRGPSGRHVGKIFLLNDGYKGMVEGICGNWNGKVEDDLYPKGQTKQYTPTEVGNSWLVGQSLIIILLYTLTLCTCAFYSQCTYY